MLDMDILLILLVHVAILNPVISQWQTRYDDHMFLYGPEVGDEKITFNDDQPAVRTVTMRPFDELQIYRDGHIELHNQRTSSRFSPFIAPYHLPYSEVTSGHVWYRETQDPDRLNEVADEIQSVFPDDGFVGDPHGMIVVTWQFLEVTPKYPECEGEVQAEYVDFCSCLDGNFIPSAPYSFFKYRIQCECFFHPMINVNVTHGTYYCNIVGSYGPDYRYGLCLGITGFYTGVAFDSHLYCVCEAHGGTQSIASCAARHTLYVDYMLGSVGCDYCECMEERQYGDPDDEIYCRCVGGVGHVGPERPDVCACLADNGYTGTEGDCSGTKRSSQQLDVDGPYKREENSEFLNTFQAAIVYNAWQTFVYFTYRKLEYSDINVVTKLGYVETTTSAFNVYTHPYSEDPFLLHSLLSDSNMNIDGRWIYKMGRNIQQPPWTPRDSCIAGVTCP